MAGRAMAMALAMGMMLLCAARVSAQELVTLPAGGLRTLGADAAAVRAGTFEALAVTLLPESHLAVLYLDGAPLEPYRPLTPAQAARVTIFSTARVKTVSIGLTVLDRKPQQKKLRIRCINRKIGRKLPMDNRESSSGNLPE